MGAMKSTPSVFILNVCLSVCTLFLTSCEGYRFNITSLSALFKDRWANHLIEEKKYDEALQTYLKILESDPNESRTHSNIGVLLDTAEKKEEALKALLLALHLAQAENDQTAQFAIHFNLGVHYGEQKNINEALTQYQAALDINPSSLETKTNIELLIQQQNGQGQGQQDQKDQQKNDKNGDSKNNDQSKKDDQKDKDKKDKDKKDQKNDEKDQEDKQKNKQVEKSEQYKPRPFEGTQLSENDVKKILGELGQQEKKIRANFDKKERKDSKHGKDW